MDLCDATDMTTCFVLASKSPARLRMLRSAGIEPVVIASGADESHLRGEDAAAPQLHRDGRHGALRGEERAVAHQNRPPFGDFSKSISIRKDMAEPTVRTVITS